MGQQVFEKFNIGMTPEEFCALDTLFCNPQLCQRDLAKLILKDRANTGKILDHLEKKGLIKRKLSIKNNRPVKIAEVTPEGANQRANALEKLRPHMEHVRAKIRDTEIGRVKDLLKQLIDILDDSLEITI